MANCVKCGAPLSEGQTFCTACGHPVAAAAAPTPPAGQAPPAGQVPPAGYPPQAGQVPPAGYPPQAYGPGGGYPPAGGYPQGYYQPPKKSNKGLWIGIGAAVVVIAVACALIFGVFKDKIFDGGGASGPENAVEMFLDAMEDKDIDKFFDLILPESLEGMTGFGMELDDVKDLIADEVFSFDSMKFSDVEMETVEMDDGTAVVTITGGTVTITEDGETETNDVEDSDTPVEFYLIEEDGTWYMDFENMW